MEGRKVVVVLPVDPVNDTKHCQTKPIALRRDDTVTIRMGCRRVMWIALQRKMVKVWKCAAITLKP